MAEELTRLAAQGARLKQLRRPIPGTGANGGRVAYEIRQADAADAAGVELRTYQAYEGGTSDIGQEAAVGLAKFFDVPVGYIREGNRGPTQLDRIEGMLVALVSHASLDAKAAEAIAAIHTANVPSAGAADAAAQALVAHERSKRTPRKRPGQARKRSD